MLHHNSSSTQAVIKVFLLPRETTIIWKGFHKHRRRKEVLFGGASAQNFRGTPI
jgi:hypothetical protein